MTMTEYLESPQFRGMLFALIVGAFAAGYFLTAILKLLRYDRPSDKPRDVGFLGEGSIRYPGYMSYSPIGSTDSLTGCYCAVFKNTNDLNEYFAPGKAGFLSMVVDLKPMSDGSILAVMNKVLSEEEKEDLREWSFNQHQFFNEKKMQRLNQKAEQEQKRLADKEEQARLAEVGRKCEHNHKKSAT